jgi:hypothetical protein
MISGDITAGRMNYEILLNKNRDHNLLQLIEGSLEPETSPVAPGDLEEFKAKIFTHDGGRETESLSTYRGI